MRDRLTPRHTIIEREIRARAQASACNRKHETLGMKAEKRINRLDQP